MNKGGCVYILTNKDNSVLYTGVTSNLQQRIWQHKTHFFRVNGQNSSLKS
jgi:putative endonuclease